MEQMQLDFYAMMQEKKKAEQKVEPVEMKKEPITKAPKEVGKEDKKKKKASVKVDTVKKEPLTLEEQLILNKDPNIAKIINHIISLGGMEEKMKNPVKTITGMWDFVQKKAREKAVNNCACIEDDEVYGWGRHYYDECEEPTE